MPKFMREKRVSLKQIKKKGAKHKSELIDMIRETVDKFDHIYVFSVKNVRDFAQKQVRREWSHSRFFFGNNKDMEIALGKTEEEEFRENIYRLTSDLQKRSALLFTNKAEKQVVKYFDDTYLPDYACCGMVALQTVELEEGALPEFSSSQEPQMRQLGLPVSLKKGVIHLMRDYTVCEKGQVLTTEQCRILRLFGHQMCYFHMTVQSMWSNSGDWKSLGKRPELIVPDRVKIKPNKTGAEQDQYDVKAGTSQMRERDYDYEYD